MAGLAIAVHMGTPCSPLSLARDRQNVPLTLRSPADPMGRNAILENSRTSDTEVIRVGYALMRVSAGMENPGAGRIWQPPPLRLLLQAQCFCKASEMS